MSSVIQLARLYGWMVYHTRDSRSSERGFPDLTLVKGDRLVFAELKSGRGIVSPAQQKWLDALNSACAEVYLWRPSDWREIEKVLR